MIHIGNDSQTGVESTCIVLKNVPHTILIYYPSLLLDLVGDEDRAVEKELVKRDRAG